MPFKCKSSHNYLFHSQVIRNVSRETMDDKGRVGFEKETIDYTDPNYIKTPRCNVMDLEVLLNSGQSIRRVNTQVLDDVERLSFAPDVIPPSPSSDDDTTDVTTD